MTTLAANPPTPQTSEQRFLLHGVSWKEYELYLKGTTSRHVFITYDRGEMELMSPTWEHERWAIYLALLVRAFANESEISFCSGGSATFRRRDVERGLESDKCFYIQNLKSILGKREVDLNVDPPPDLAIEVEVSRRLLDRVGIYEALGIPELWRFDGKRLRIFVLGDDGRYVEQEQSLALPGFPAAHVGRFIEKIWRQDEAAWEKWVRKEMRPYIPRKRKGRRKLK